MTRPTASPQASAAARPTATNLSSPPIVFIATALASPILAGSDKSTLPGPSVMTNICPTPTMTVNTDNDSAAVSIPPAP